MSGTAPSDSATGGHSGEMEQTLLDMNQHGQAQNILDETKDTFGSVVDRNVGESIDAGKRQAGLSAHAKDVLNQMSSGTGDMGIKGNEAMGEGFKVGEKADLHALAQSKQP